MKMTRPAKVALISSAITGVVLAIPSYCFAEAIVSPQGGEMVARWLALSITFFGMIASAGISYGVTKATMEVKMAGMKEVLAEQKELLKGIFSALEVRPTTSALKDRRDLEEKIHAVELQSVKESIDALRQEFFDFRRSMGDQRRTIRQTVDGPG